MVYCTYKLRGTREWRVVHALYQADEIMKIQSTNLNGINKVAARTFNSIRYSRQYNLLKNTMRHRAQESKLECHGSGTLSTKPRTSTFKNIYVHAYVYKYRFMRRHMFSRENDMTSCYKMQRTRTWKPECHLISSSQPQIRRTNYLGKELHSYTYIKKNVTYKEAKVNVYKNLIIFEEELYVWLKTRS